MCPIGHKPLEIFPKVFERAVSADTARSNSTVPNGTVQFAIPFAEWRYFVAVIGIILSQLPLRECRGDAMTIVAILPQLPLWECRGDAMIRVFVANWRHFALAIRTIIESVQSVSGYGYAQWGILFQCRVEH